MNKTELLEALTAAGVDGYSMRNTKAELEAALAQVGKRKGTPGGGYS